MFNRIKKWWRWSRTIFLNVLSGVGLILAAILPVLMGADWASIIHDPKLLLAITVGTNIANVLLRLITTGPVGIKPDEPQS